MLGPDYLFECTQLSARSQSLPELDRIVLLLKDSCDHLGGLLATEHSLTPSDEVDFHQLLTYIRRLCLDHETQLLFILPMNPSYHVRSFTRAGRGRPRKIINVALVSLEWCC